MSTAPRPATATRPAKIISFYSYMGGGDRTMAVANIACILAGSGKSVLVVDWNLDAPGLHLYYKAFLPDPDLANGAGLLDMFHGFDEAAHADGEPLADLSELYGQHADLSPYAVALNLPLAGGGRLEYVGPGQLDDTYAERVRSFHWGAFHASEEGRAFLEVLRTRLQDSGYDYVLIDSGSGWCDGTDICTLALPDTVVFSLGMHVQAIEGAKRVAQRIAKHHRGIRIHVLPTGIGEISDRLKERMRQARRALGPFLDVPDDDLDSYWEEVQVPYLSLYSYGAELAVLTENPRQPIGVLGQYVNAVRRITDGKVTGFTPLRPRPHLDDIDVPPDGRTVSLLYAPHDQMWAEWIGAQLRQTGIKVTEPVNGAGVLDGAALPAAHSFMVLLSANLSKSPVSATVERLATPLPGGSGGEHRLIGVRLDHARLPEHLDWPDALYLAGQAEEGARTALLAGFGLRAKEYAAGSGGPRFPDHPTERWNAGVRNVSFTGRVQELGAIREHFGSEPASPRGSLVLTGMGGVGKSQIALEYAHRFRSQYDLVWWIPASETSGIRTALAGLTKEFQSSDPGGLPSGDAQRLLDVLRRGTACRSWLLVFDDAPSWEAVQDWVSVLTGGVGHVLITSRNPQWSACEAHRINTFEAQESLGLLAHRLPGFADADLLRVADRLGHLPIGVNVAAEWLVTGLQSVDEYLAAPPAAVEDPQWQHFVDTYLRAYQQLKERFPAAAKLLDLCSFMSPDGISMKVVQSRGMLSRLAELDPELESSYRLRVLINALAVGALAVADPLTRTLKVHRLVQDLLRERMSPDERAEARAQALTILAAMAPTDIERDDPEHRDILAELDRHLEVTQAPASDDPAVLAWTVTQVRYRWFFGEDWASAIELGERVLAQWREKFGTDNAYVLRLESQVAPAYRHLGKYRPALKLSEHTATTQQRQNRRDPYTLIAQHGYGADLRAAGRFQDADDVHQRTYRDMVSTLGDDHYETLNASNNLAISKFYLQSVPHALRQDQTTFETRRRVLGDRHPLTWHSYTSLGGYHREMWQLRTAENHLTEARDRLVELAGPDASATLRALWHLGMTWVRRGALPAAMQLLQDTHAAMQRNGGDTSPGAMACRLALAAALHADNCSGDAAEYTKAELERHIAVWGEDHPFTAICRSNLALYLLDANEPECAWDIAGKAVRRLRDSLSHDHRYTLVARINRNNCAVALGKGTSFDIAGEDQEIHDLCKADYNWGTHHPVTLIAAANLAASQPETGAELRAAVAHDAVAQVGAECIGDDSPLTAALTAPVYRRLGFDLEVWGV